jgi:hypothetical protein
MTCFVLTATNVALALHLAEHHKGEHHDSEHCPVCQQAVINKNFAILQSPPKVYQVNEIQFTIGYSNFFSPQIVKFQFPPSRAPPPVS